MSGINKFLTYKYGFNARKIPYEDWLSVAEYEGISIEWVNIDHSEGHTAGMLCWGHGNRRMHRPVIFLRGTPDDDINLKPKARFTLMHEMGHFYLHPFLKYLDFDDGDKIPEQKEFYGYLEYEADLFAVMSFIPTKYLQEKYETKVIEHILMPNCEEKLKLLIKTMFDDCEQQTKHLPGYDPSEPLTPRIIRNLSLRIQKFVNEIREKIIVHSKELDTNKIGFDKLTNEDKQEVVESIKNAFSKYDIEF